MDAIKLNVYDENGKIVKTCEAGKADIEFGTIRAIMELLNVENAPDTITLMKIIYNAWDQLTAVLNQCFVEMRYEDWNHVKVNELIPVLFNIVRYSFDEMLTIPQEKNLIAG